jgi:NAD(P)H-hydrate repair Nnr-like enzyme with NAD(P)H-hydrate epimerase domain
MTEEFDPTSTSDLLMRLKGEIEGLKLWLHVLIATHPNVGAAKALMEQMQGGVVIDGAIGTGFSDTVRGLMETAERISGQPGSFPEAE